MALLCIFNELPASEGSNQPIVCFENDFNQCVRGTLLSSTDGEDPFEAFIGIPFAEPPIGDLRFAVII